MTSTLAFPAEVAISLRAAVYEQSLIAMLLENGEHENPAGKDSLIVHNLAALLLALIKQPAAAE